MTDLLQENLYYLYQHKRDMFEQIQQYLEKQEEKKCKLVFNDNGFANLTYVFDDGIKYLYAEDGNDIHTWLLEHSTLKQGKYDVVMYGLGLSHHLAKMIEINPQLNFYILEPELDVFVEALKIINIDQLLQHPQIKMVYLGNGKEEMRSFHILVNTYSAAPKIDVVLPYYTQINVETIREYFDYNYTQRESELIEMGFEKSFGTLPYRNSIKNLKHIQNTISIQQLKEKFKNCTALIVGAGPSLEVDIAQIKMARDKLLIIAAGSSIQSLHHYGIQPHLIVSMDPGEANARVFNNVDTSDIPLVFIPQIHYEALEVHNNKNIYAFFSNDPITNYIFSERDIDFKFSPTNSVTGTAIQVAKYLGASTILFTGQDLSFPNETYYAQGASHTNSDYLNKKVVTSQLEVENVNGTLNKTDLSMKSALENIEQLLTTIKGVNFINTSSLGAKIKGADFVPFTEAVTGLTSSYNFEELQSSFEKSEHDNMKLVNLSQRLEAFVDSCNEIIDDGKSSINLISKIDEFSRRNPNKAMNLLAQLEQEFSKVTQHQLFQRIITSWNRNSTKQYDREVIKIENEPTIIGKARLLNQIVVPYIDTVIESCNEIIEEIKSLKLGDHNE